MKKQTYSKILMAPLFMLLAVACSPNQFNQSTEYDDVYFTASDRTAAPVKKQAVRAAQLQSQEQTATLENYSSDKLDEQIVTKYNNGTEPTVTYFEEGPIVKRAADLNYDDFLADYNNQQLAQYDLPLDWDNDWDRIAFNSTMQQDFQFSLAWYDHYYRGQSLRMEQYLNGSFAGVSRRGGIGRPAIGLTAGFSNVNVGFVNMAFVDINPWGFYDPFWSPIRARRGGFGFGFGWNNWGFRNSWAGGWGWNNWGWNDPFFCPPGGSFGWGGFGWRNSWRNNVFVNNNIIIDRRNDRIIAANRSGQSVRRGPRVGTSRVSTVRNEAINGSTPTTRSSRYVDNLDGNSSATARSRSGRANSGRANSTNSVVSRTGRSITNGRNNRVNTSAYRFEDSRRGSRSSAVRNNGSNARSSQSSRTRAVTSRQGSRSGYSSARSSSRSQSSPSFNRNSSSRSYGNSRTSRSYNNGNSSRSSSSRNAYSRGSSSRSSSGAYSRGSSSRSSSGSRSSYSRGGSSRSSGSMSRGSSRSSGSRSSGSMSRGNSSRSSGSRSSSSSRSSSRSSSSSRSGRGN